jgi:hypothetical protein
LAGQSPTDLECLLQQAAAHYVTTWQAVDTELYNLCRRRPSQRTFADVYTKTAFIGRVYQAGIERAFRGKGDPQSAVAQSLIEQADLIDRGLAQLNGQSFDRSAAAPIIELHGRITLGLAAYTGGVRLTSFVSKYLHFHCPIVPIYDSLAAGAIGKYVDWVDVDKVRAPLMALPDCAREYRNYVAAFVVLYEQARRGTTLQPRVRDVDYLLWQPAPVGSDREDDSQ